MSHSAGVLFRVSQLFAVVAISILLNGLGPADAHADGLQCPPGYSLDGEVCTQTIPATPDTVGYTCPSGYDLNEDPQYCQHLVQPEPYCEAPYSWTGEWCAHTVPEPCPAGSAPFMGVCLFVDYPQLSCPADYFLFNDEVCVHLVSSTPQVVYTCPADFVLDGQNCTATVAPELPPQELIGFDEYYSTYWPVSASSNDLYVVRDNIDGNFEGVTGFILEEQPDSSYTLNANPTSAQISQFDLNSPANIAYELADINLDGAMDMVLMDGTTAASIVYADTNSGSAPIAFKYIDAEFVEFFADLYQGILNPDYFYDTAYENNWGTWSYSPYLEFLSYNTVMLHKSGQLFRPGLIDHPPQEPISGTPFYTDISEAYDGENEPYWCAQTLGFYEFNPITGSWWVEGWYLPAWFTPDYSYFNEDAMEVAAPIAAYLGTESPAYIPAFVFQILEDILGTSHDLDNEPAIYNLIQRMGQVLFGIGVEQEATLPNVLAKVELLYTDLLEGMIPYARHAYLQVTFPNGNQYMTAGWPEDEPTFPPFGYLFTDWALNPTSDEAFGDYGKPIRFRQLVGHTTLSEVSISGSMVMVTANVNSCDIPYFLVTYNSNSYAFQSVPIITGLPRPTAEAFAPGSGAVIPCP